MVEGDRLQEEEEPLMLKDPNEVGVYENTKGVTSSNLILSINGIISPSSSYI